MLEPENVYIHMKKTSQKVIDRRLADLWATSEPKSNTNIVWEKTERRKFKITKIKYYFVDHQKLEYQKEGEELIDIQGNVYPQYMVTDNFEVLSCIISEYISKGKRTKSVAWIKE